MSSSSVIYSAGSVTPGSNSDGSSGSTLLPIPVKSRTVKTDKPRPFLCPICTRGFVRQEHLKRHQKSHTNEKPFLCIFCGRCFARRDLVLRHQHKLHSTLISIDDQGKNINHDTSRVHDFLHSILISKQQQSSTLESPVANTASASPIDMFTEEPHSLSGSPSNPIIERSTDRNNVSDKHIIKINGNKRSILPTLSNPLAKSAAELKKEAKLAAKVAAKEEANLKRNKSKVKKFNKVTKKGYSPSSARSSPVVTSPYTPEQRPNIVISEVTNEHNNDYQQREPDSLFAINQQSYRHKRHASFSASSALTYMENQKQPATQQEAADLEFRSDIPHQVGFSTPQMSAKQVYERALECGVDLNFLELPTFLSLDNNSSNQNGQQNQNELVLTSQDPVFNTFGDNHGQGSFASNNDHNNQQQTSNVATFDSIHQIDSMAMLSDFLTMGSSYGGSAGFAKVNPISNSNLDYFSYIPTTSKSFLNIKGLNKKINKKESLLREATTSRSNTQPVGSPNFNDLNDHVMLKQESIQSLPDHKLNGSNDTYSDNSSIKSNSQSLLGSSTALSLDDHLFQSFMSHTPLETDFQTSFDHLNDIGFSESNFNTISQNLPVNSNTVHINQHNTNHTSGNFNSVIPPSSQDNNNLNQYNTNKPPHRIDSHYDVSNIFASRQMNLFKQNIDFDSITNPNRSAIASSSSSPSIFEANDVNNHVKPFQVTESFPKQKSLLFYTQELRSAIIRDNQLTSEQFPKVDELNKYVNLFRDHFHNFFPFIHLNSAQLDISNYPLLLSITMVGALYDFHSKHAMLLSNIAWFHIRDYLHKPDSNYAKTPLWIIQSIVLLIFLSIFSNDVHVIKSIRQQFMTLIELVKLTKLNLPLENFVRPPIESDHVLEFQDNPVVLENIRRQYNTPEQLRNNYEYFILAQTRIRTCHTILMATNFYSSLIGIDNLFHSIDLKCGVPCDNEVLFHVDGPQVWSNYLIKFNVTLDSKFSLIELSNGSGTYESCLMYLTNGSPYVFENIKPSKKTLMSLLVSVHERIFIERSNIKKARNSTDDNDFNETKLRMNSRSIVSSMLKHWEALYIKNGGILIVTKDNISKIMSSPVMRLIIPLHGFAKIRKCVDMSEVLTNIWKQKWDVMNNKLNIFYTDKESLSEAAMFSLEILDFWIRTVDETNGERLIATTPIPSTTCIFIAILIISEYARTIEKWSFNKNMIMNGTSPMLSILDRILWLNVFKSLKKIEVRLMSHGYNMEIPQAAVLNETYAEHAMKPDTPIQETAQMINSIGLSSHCLYLGVRVLSGSPVWAVSLLFAQALQSRALYNDMDMFTSHSV